MERELTLMEKALMKEIEWFIEEEYGEDFELEEEDKLKLAQEIIDKEDSLWEELNGIIYDRFDEYKFNKINSLNEEIEYLEKEMKCCAYGKRELHELEAKEYELAMWESI